MRLEMCQVEDSEDGLLSFAYERLNPAPAPKKDQGDVDIAEIFSPPRVAERARRRGLNGGWSLDVAAVDPTTGRTWDLRDPNVVKSAWRLYHKTHPKLLVCSPPCTLFSQIQSLNEPPSEERMSEALADLELCISMCRAQQKAGRYFLFEHPGYATSWRTPGLDALRYEDFVFESLLHMCQYNMCSCKDGVEGLVYKPTRILTNSQAIAEKMSKKCQGDHDHIKLEGGNRCAKASKWSK